MLFNAFPFNRLSAKSWLWTAAGVLILGQIVLLIGVVSDQVRAAEVRDSRLAQKRLATEQCIESSRGAALKVCMDQATAEPRVVKQVRSEPLIASAEPEDARYAPARQSPSLLPRALASDQ